MIGAVYAFGVAAALVLDLTALTLVARRWIEAPAVARAAGLLALGTVLFSVEHFVGLGDLGIAFLPLTAASAWLVWRERLRAPDPAFRHSQIVLLAALAFCALCRLASPEIVEDNDRLTDFHLVANYMTGGRLPPPDHWFPPQHLDYYYAFQHYLAGLIGRFAGLAPGTSFNVGAILIQSLVLTLAWEVLTALKLGRAGRALSIAALAIGGTGVSPLFHLVTAPAPDPVLSYGSARHAMLYNSRFAGWFEDAVASGLWRTVSGGGTERAAMLPIETFGYQIPLGGYHAPLAGFLLLFLALAIMVRGPAPAARERSVLEAVLGATIPLAIVANAWVFPLQAALVVAWKGWDWRANGRRDLAGLAAGFLVALVLLTPALRGLAAETGYTRLTLVAAGARTPLVQFLIVHWPLLVLSLLVPFAGPLRSAAGLFAVLFLGLLLLGEIFNISDPNYSGAFERFNPALKWWGWTFTGGVFALSALLMAGEAKAARIGAAIVLVLTATFAFDSGRFILFRGIGSSLALDGTGAYAANPANARLIDYLRDAPPGIVLEKVNREPPLDTGIYGSFSEKPDVVGIPWVLNVWQRNLPDLPRRVEAVAAFYAGASEDPRRFLADHSVRYVVWSAREADDPAWQAIEDSIGDAYRWIEFSPDRARHVGLWERRPVAP